MTRAESALAAEAGLLLSGAVLVQLTRDVAGTRLGRRFVVLARGDSLDAVLNDDGSCTAQLAGGCGVLVLPAGSWRRASHGGPS